ncbi:MAG: sulfite exporter TauE/SafE family protein [Acidobacteriota bacterium]
MILAWIGAVAIGLSLGLLGSGGSILTVPVLVYLVGQDEKVAIAGSLAIVGGIALIGGIDHALRRLVVWRSVLLFGVPGMLGTYGGAWLAKWVSGTFQLAVFAGVMLLAAVLMLRSPLRHLDESRPTRAPWKIAIDGLVVGVLTGFVGVGGGFLIVPALVLLGGLSMHHAIGTSLMIIALKSYTGFFKYLEVLAELDLQLDWPLIGIFIALGAGGTYVGRSLGKRLPQQRLKQIFAVFLIVIGVLILWQSLPEMLGGS